MAIFTANRWTQFQADRLHHGFRAVRSLYALQPKWTIDIVGAPSSSPVVAEDGTIYIGDRQGRLVAVNPDGSIKWMVTLVSTGMLSTPAVAEDNNIYIISSRLIEDRFRSTLHSVAPDGSLRWSSEFPSPLHTSASPTTWSFEQRVYIFIYTGFWLLIYNDVGGLLEQEDLTLCKTITGDGLLGDILDVWWEIITEGGVDFDTSGFVPPPTPTVAVVDSSNVTPPNQPIVVVVSRCGVIAQRWNLSDFTPLWSDSFDPDAYYFSSPAVIPFGTLMVGREDGRVLAYAVDTGEKLWEYNAKESVFSTPASFGRQWYIASTSHLHVIDFNGSLLHKFELPNVTRSSPVLTASLVYLQFIEGLHTFSFNLDAYSVDGSAGRYAITSPAVGPDGTIYVALGLQGLRAYPGAS